MSLDPISFMELYGMTTSNAFYKSNMLQCSAWSFILWKVIFYIYVLTWQNKLTSYLIKSYIHFDRHLLFTSNAFCKSNMLKYAVYNL